MHQSNHCDGRKPKDAHEHLWCPSPTRWDLAWKGSRVGWLRMVDSSFRFIWRRKQCWHGNQIRVRFRVTHEFSSERWCNQGRCASSCVVWRASAKEVEMRVRKRCVVRVAANWVEAREEVAYLVLIHIASSLEKKDATDRIPFPRRKCHRDRVARSIANWPTSLWRVHSGDEIWGSRGRKENEATLTSNRRNDVAVKKEGAKTTD